MGAEWVEDGCELEVCAGCAGCDSCGYGAVAPMPCELVGDALAGDSDSVDGGYVVVEVSAADLGTDLGAPARRRQVLESAQRDARARYVAPADLVPWRGVLGFTEAEAEAYGVRALPGASPRLAAYVGRLSDGPTVSFAWWLAWCQVTGCPQRFADPDRGDPSVWNSRKLPAQVAQRVRRLAFDSRPYVGGAA